MSLCALGSYEALISAGEDILSLIHTDIKEKTGIELTKPLTLRHVTIYGNTGDIFVVNGFNFELRDDVWSSPNNDNSNLISITSLSALQSGDVTIYYLR